MRHFAVPFIRNQLLEMAVQFIHILFGYDGDLKWGIQGYTFCLLANQLKGPTVAVCSFFFLPNGNFWIRKYSHLMTRFWCCYFQTSCDRIRFQQRNPGPWRH